MSPRNTLVLIAFVVSGAAIAGAGCAFARKVARAGNCLFRSKLISMKKSISLIQMVDPRTSSKPTDLCGLFSDYSSMDK
jgi:hypothetical protein